MIFKMLESLHMKRKGCIISCDFDIGHGISQMLHFLVEMILLHGCPKTLQFWGEDKDKGTMEIYEVFMMGRYGMEQCMKMEFYSWPWTIQRNSFWRRYAYRREKLFRDQSSSSLGWRDQKLKRTQLISLTKWRLL